MSHETFALNLCKANAELQLEFGRLLLENAQRNLELLQRGAAQGLALAQRHGLEALWLLRRGGALVELGLGRLGGA